MLKQNRPDIARWKASKAVVVSAILSDEILTLKTSIQISLSACGDGGMAYEMPGGGALRQVGLFSWFATYSGSVSVRLHQAFIDYMNRSGNSGTHLQVIQSLQYV